MAAPSLPVQVLLGVYLGLLTGILPALVAWALAFVFKYVTGLTVPSFAVVVLGVAMAGVNGGFMAFNDPTVLQSANSVTLLTAILVVMLVAFYAHNMGDRFGAALPRRLTLRGLRDRTLSREVVELVEGRNRVRVRVVGAVEDMEGYPPLSPALRDRIRTATREWTFPAELTLPELEAAVADRLREEFDCADAAVVIDERARASVTAAPPFSGLSAAVPDGERAVTVGGLVPTGLSPGDEVTVLGGIDRDDADRGALSARDGGQSSGEPDDGAAAVSGTVLAASVPADETDTARTVDAGASADADPADDLDGADDGIPTAAPQAPPSSGGAGSVTVAVDRTDAPRLLTADDPALVVSSRGTRREFELLSLLRRAGQRIRHLTVREDGPLAGSTIGGAGVRGEYGVVVLAVRSGGEWAFAPRGETAVDAGDELFVAGSRAAVERFGAVAR